MHSYEGKWTLVTGAGRRGRVGADIARHFAEKGSDILLHFRSDQEEAVAVKEEIEKGVAGRSVQLISGDLTNRDDVAKLFTRITPDIVIHNAAIFEPATLDASHSLTQRLEEVERAFTTNLDANLKAAHLVTEAAIHQLRKRKKTGVIVFVGDAFIEKGGTYPENLAAYTASKAPLTALVRHYAHAYGKEGLRFIAVLNGPIEPPRSAPREAVEKIASEIPLPKEKLNPWIGGAAVAQAIDALIQSGINGEGVAVDGGRSWTTSKEH